MKIGNREISSAFPPYIVAEISCNHVGSLAFALRLIDEAKNAGADAVKFQCFQPDTITLDCDKPDFIVKDGPWKGRKLYELYRQCETPRDWFPALFAHARKIGIEIFSSVFSPNDVDFMEQYDPPCYKIASMESNDLGLIAYASMYRPLIVSTGMASASDILEVIKLVPENKLCLLHCVSGYPTQIEDAGLTVKHRSIEYDGISDHSGTATIPIAATALGAALIEKHLMLETKDYQNGLPEDFYFSLHPLEFTDMCILVRKTWQAMQPSKRKSEESSRQMRRSLYVVQDMKAGERFTTENVRSIRPSYGLPPKELGRVLNHHAAHAIERGTALEEGMLVPF